MNPYGLSLPATSESDSLRRQDPVQRQQNTAEIRRLAQRRLDELKRRKSCLVEAFVYQAAIDENTYPEERHNLDQQVALAELEHLEAHEDEIEVEGALNFSAYELSNAGRLWGRIRSERQATVATSSIPAGPNVR